MDTNLFDACEICNSNDWTTVYRGSIRNGSFGKFTDCDAAITQCRSCGVERLDESSCKKEDIYLSEEYRCLLNQPTDSEGFFDEHDKLQIRNLNVLWPYSLRDKLIADIGCGVGSFLDHVRGLAKKAIAVEPCQVYHESLTKRGYQVYPYVKDALLELKGAVDFAFCLSVIEHISNPVLFLEEVSLLLKHNGIFIASIPNRRDILMELLPDLYPSFFITLFTDGILTVIL